MAPSLFYGAGSWSLAEKCWSLLGAFENQLFPIRLGSTWHTFPEWPQAYPIRLNLGAWLQNAGFYQEPLEINFSQLGLEAAGQVFPNWPNPIL